eukprot:Skav227524  [mRNA]  locus=scaffold2269:150935:152822:+ [translate_table: standard]
MFLSFLGKMLQILLCHLARLFEIGAHRLRKRSPASAIAGRELLMKALHFNLRCQHSDVFIHRRPQFTTPNLPKHL